MLTRRARVHDAAAIGQVRVLAWQAAYGPFMPSAFLNSLDPTANLDGLRRELESEKPRLAVEVAEHEGRVVGFAIVGAPRHAAAPTVGELWALNVHPRYWRSGAGRSLVSASISIAAGAAYDSIELWCIRDNAAAISLYDSAGFFLAGQSRETSALTGSPLPEVLYRRRL